MVITLKTNMFAWPSVLRWNWQMLIEISKIRFNFEHEIIFQIIEERIDVAFMRDNSCSDVRSFEIYFI
jgi:hypothetical protein